MGFDTRGSVQTMSPFTCSKRKRVLIAPFFLLVLDEQESRTPRGDFAFRKRLIIVFSKIWRAIYNCEGGGFPKEKHGLSSPAPTKHTSKTLDYKVYGSVFCFLSPFFPVWLVVARNTIEFLTVFRAKISLIPPLRKKSHPKTQIFYRK